MSCLHHKPRIRIYRTGAQYFVTSVTFDRYPYFKNPILAELFVRDLWFAKVLKEFDLFGYTVMPDHVHLLFEPKGTADYSEIMRSLKTNFSRNANDILLNRVKRIQLGYAGDVTSHRLRNEPTTNTAASRSPRNEPTTNTTASRSLRNEPGTNTTSPCPPQHQNIANSLTAFPKQEYEWYYLNVVKPLHQRFVTEYGLSHGIPHFRWQKSFHDHLIRGEHDFLNHLEYIYNNALKHGVASEPRRYPFMWIQRMRRPLVPD
jgi:REP element-mobilizing transposase RayT